MIEVTDGAIVVTGDHIGVYDVLSFRSALGLEIRTGLKMRPGFSIVSQGVKRGYLPEGTRDKCKAYAILDALVVSLGGTSRPIIPNGKSKAVSMADLPKGGTK